MPRIAQLQSVVPRTGRDPQAVLADLAGGVVDEALHQYLAEVHDSIAGEAALVGVHCGNPSALRYLVRRVFAPGLVYSGKARRRWVGRVRPALERYAQEYGLSWREAWEDLCGTALALALAEVETGLPWYEFRKRAASCVRAAIERALAAERAPAAQPPPPMAAEAPTALAEAALAAIAVDEALAQLPQLDRAVLLAYAAGYTAREIAGVLCVSEQSVRVRVFRSRKKLTEKLGWAV